MALNFLWVSSLGWAQASESDLSLRICANLAAESKYILNDTSTTTKYLSPYIAAEIYQQVVAKTLAGADIAEAPSMAELPCNDEVSSYLMAIKKRMEYNRIDILIANHRDLITCVLILFGIATLSWFVYRKKQSVREDSVRSV